ncbi:hypothetical protein AMTR_s00105p00032100 [Amborella trichopoda]|uniref:Uncharacterized protein n=1 Tax=Amborella trichopoda TaxID=13333 RepID=W1NXL7_AMBTC|nr:hypothetical protein AMTR_s00105p00032100 [Amborella trichopoda]
MGTHVMKTINESLIKTGERSTESSKRSRNVYHEFNDGILPLYIIAQIFKGELVVAMVECHEWWIIKYGDMLLKLSNYQLLISQENEELIFFVRPLLASKFMMSSL